MVLGCCCLDAEDFIGFDSWGLVELEVIDIGSHDVDVLVL